VVTSNEVLGCMCEGVRYMCLKGRSYNMVSTWVVVGIGLARGGFMLQSSLAVPDKRLFSLKRGAHGSQRRLH
jgi:hypothetical protein